MNKDFNISSGMARLERAIRLCMAGWGAKPAAFAKS
jgi:hypothetical protein